MKRKIRIILFVIFYVMILLTNYCQAMGFATAIGTVDNTITDPETNETSTITTTTMIEKAADYYGLAGYSMVNKLTDPSYTLLVSNLMAEVQFFATHGSLDSIRFVSPTGIVTGESIKSGGKELIGVSDVGAQCWANNTKLVTYMACNTGGLYGIANNTSLVHNTVALGGVDVSLGFKKEISYSLGAYDWARRYNTALACGYGVQSAADYADSFTYEDNRVKSWYLVYNSETSSPDIKIGTYATSELISIEESYQELKLDRKNILENQISLMTSFTDEKTTMTNVLKNIDNNFNADNYEITKEVANIEDCKNGTTKTIEYIDAILKIGDFYTKAGYTMKIEDNKIIAIYDNNIDIEKQKVALENKEMFQMELSKTTLSNLKNSAVTKTLNAYENKNIIIEEPFIRYYYDIENNKKYVEISVTSQISDDVGTAKAVDTVRYEI